MRAYLINSEQQTIDEIDCRNLDDYREVDRLLGCKSCTEGSRPLRGSLERGFDTVLVSNDPAEDDPGVFWFQIDADRNPPSSFPICGNGLVTGVDPKGSACDVQIPIEEVRARIRFTRRRFRGFDTRKTEHGIIIAAKTPIIDDGPAATPVTPSRSYRPDSWNAKMVSGEPLITDEQFEQLLTNGREEVAASNPVPVVKIFLPHVRWLLVGIVSDDLDHVIAVVRHGAKKAQLVLTKLSEIINSRLVISKGDSDGIRPERDKYITLNEPWPYYLSNTDW
jgi:hypothetical protein